MKFFNQKITLIFVLILFAVSRWYIFSNPPASYSDVKADYERYANMWWYGLPPYLEHLYEYPPATIPLLLTPLALDQNGIGKYYSNYRTEILIIDTVFFIYLLFLIPKIPWLSKRKFESLLAYIVLTTFAKDFFYEGIDLAFTASACVSFTLLYFMPNEKSSKKSWFVETLIWAFFWLSVAIKFLTLPLIVPLFLFLHRGKLVQQILTVIIGFFIVWGIPLAMYRSSLQVMFVHNNNRPIKYASFPAHIIRWANSFTKSEEQRMVAPDFEYQGPISNQVTKVNKIIFPLAILSTISAMAWVIWLKTASDKRISVQSIQEFMFKPKQLDAKSQLSIMLMCYVLYIFVLFITAKIFSQPFHIWYIAPVVLLPFQKKLHWYLVAGLCLLMILLDMTTYLHIKNNFLVFNKVEIGLLRDTLRFIPMFIIIGMVIQELKHNLSESKTS